MLKPVTLLEKRVAVWPPSSPVGDWLSRLLLAPWDRWDVEHFQRIASVGYLDGEGTLAFQPLFPFLGKWVGMIFGGNDLLGLVLVSNVCSFFFLLILFYLAKIDLPQAQAYRTAIYFMALPVAFILYAPYSESLFLLFCVCSILMARQGRWMLAGIAGGLAALTRQQGLFLVVPLAWELWEITGRNWRAILGHCRQVLSIALCPAAYGTWVLYRAIALNDVILDLRKPHQIFYGLLLSPNANKVIPNQKFLPPWDAFLVAVHNVDSVTTIDLLVGGIYLSLLVVVARRLWRLRQSYFIYTIILFVVSFSYSTGPPHAYQGLPRHCLLAFPLVMALSMMVRQKLIYSLIITLGQVFLMVLSFFYFCRVFWLP